MGRLMRILAHTRLPRGQSIGFYICKFIFLLGLLYAALNRIYYFEDYSYTIGFFEFPKLFNNSLLEQFCTLIRSKKDYLLGFECIYIITILVNMFVGSALACFFLLSLQLLNMTVFWPNSISSETVAHYFLILFFFTELAKIHGSRRLRALHFLWGIRAIQLQQVIMYFFSGTEKLLDPAWFKGLALGYLFKMDYTVKYDLSIFDRFQILYNISTYAVLIFECFFFLILVSPHLRPALIIFGISMHILIGILLGHIWDLSIISISLYALFIDWRKFLVQLKFLRNLKFKFSWLTSLGSH